MPRQYIRDPANPLKWIPVGGGSGPSVITEHQAVVIRQPDASYVLQTSFAELSYAFSIQRPISLFVEIQSGVFQRFDLATHGINDDGEYFVFAQVILEDQIATGTTIIIKNERGIVSVSEVRAELNNPGVDSEITQDEVINALGYTPLSEEILSEFAKQVVLYAPQNELTGEQKAIARKNIGAIGLNSVIVFVANDGVLEAYTVSEDNGTLVGPMTGEEIKIAVSPSGGRYQVFVPNGDGLTEAKLIGEWDEEEKTCVFFHANRAPDGQSILVKIPLEETTGTYKDVPNANAENAVITVDELPEATEDAPDLVFLMDDPIDEQENDTNVDPTLSIEGMAADAAAVGAALSKISTQKVDVDQGVENAGKLLGIGTGGIVVPVDAPSGGVGTDPNAIPAVDELPPANDDAPSVVYLVDDETDGESGGITEETDPTVPDWAKQPEKPTYTAEEVGALSKDTVIPTVPNALPNPHKLKFTGAVSAEYDGSSEVSVEIPDGSSGSGGDYTLPVASPETLGGVMPEAKSDEMTQPVGVDALGALWTIPGGSGSGGDGIPVPETAAVGQTIRVAEVDATGKPIAWEPADFPVTVTDTVLLDKVLEEEVATIGTPSFTASEIDELDEIHFMMEIVPTADETKTNWGWLKVRFNNERGGIAFEIFTNGNPPRTIPPCGGKTVLAFASMIRNPILRNYWMEFVRYSNSGTYKNEFTYSTPASGGTQLSLMVTGSDHPFGVGTKIKIIGRRYQK